MYSNGNNIKEIYETADNQIICEKSCKSQRLYSKYKLRVNFELYRKI